MARKGFVYVVHMLEKLSHAQHYIGCTEHLKERLSTHAQGKGARILEVCSEKGIEWTLGGIGSIGITEMRKAERWAKNQHNASRFCTICNGEDALAIPGTIPYPVDIIAFATDSVTIRGQGFGKVSRIVRMTTRDDPIWFSRACKELADDDKDALGFIPAGGEGGITGSIERGHVSVLITDNNQLDGYAAYTVGIHDDDPIRIHQVCVRESLRGCGYGRALIAAIAQEGKAMRVKVRDDLIANTFWTQIGFEFVMSQIHKTSGNKINIYTKEK